MKLPLKVDVELAGRHDDDFLYMAVISMPNSNTVATLAKVNIPADGQPTAEILTEGLLAGLDRDLISKFVLLFARFCLNEMAQESGTAIERSFKDVTELLVRQLATPECAAVLRLLVPLVPSNTEVVSKSVVRID